MPSLPCADYEDRDMNHWPLRHLAFFIVLTFAMPFIAGALLK
ncbi:hypothetical protein [Mesorhizobium caraganae]|nr:hypothetical protein [Mesorhizobium caraganae]